MTTATLQAIQTAGEDFEWYPTTDRMIAAVADHIPTRIDSLMDFGAGDGRVLTQLAQRCEYSPTLYAIEKSTVLIQAQPEDVIPIGTDLYEQNLACLPVDYIFCNPPYSAFETWARIVIESGYAKKAFLVIPRRWKESRGIAEALKSRGATAHVIHSDDFLDAERRARAVVDVVEITYPLKARGGWTEEVKDPFDIWFDQHIDTFDRAEDQPEDDDAGRDVAKQRDLTSIGEMVAAYNEEYARMEENYRAIFRLDYAILKELGVNKEHVREGIKKKMAGLKTKYWRLLFERLDTITRRLATETKKRFLDKLTGRTSIAFTANNAYAVVLWAIKNANKYYDEQLVKLFRDLSTFDGVENYKSNQRTWEKNAWRYSADDHSHYALDYRFVVDKWAAICNSGYEYEWDYPGNLHTSSHELIEDVIAVLYNLGFACDFITQADREKAREASELVPQTVLPSRDRRWNAGKWQDFLDARDETLFQVKAHKNGNLHFRFMPEAIKALNVEAGRLLGWLKSPADVARELGYTPEESQRYFGSNLAITPSSIKLLAGPVQEAA